MNGGDQKTVIVTGAGAGIGRGVALGLGDAGWNVVVADLDEEGGRTTAALLQQRGAPSTFVKTDVTVEAEVASLIDAAISTFGSLTAAVNNAGIVEASTPLHEMDDATWQRVIDVNLTAVWRCMKHEIRHLLVSEGGSIVNMSSKYGWSGGPLRAAYTASKHGIIGLTRTAALEYGDRGIRVNALCPSAVRTPMLERQIEQRPEVAVRWNATSLLTRLAEPAEIAAAAVWLCSDAASFVNGVALPVDGGAFV
jgi:NAD(P)-dependent dehydrogenase (short-subunit alcohol dehydrogenase family)